jgi:predicted ATPase
MRPEATYLFKHALVQDAAYGTLLRSRRQRLHGRIAATLEDRFPEIAGAQPALLAQHCAEAGLGEKAVGYSLKAGQQAMDRSAMTEAVAQLRKGLEVLAGLPDGPWSQQRELDLQIALGVALSATVGWSTAETEKIHDRVRRLAEKLDRPEHLVPLIWGQFAFHFVRSEHRLALAIGERLEQIGEVRNDAAVTFMGRYVLGVVRVELGEFVAARAALQGCVGLADPAHLAMAVNSFDPYPPMLMWLAVTLASLGYIDQARSLRDEALLEARRLGHVHTLTFVFANQNFMHWLTRTPMANIEESLL